MQGFYVYCIRPHNADTKKIASKGIESGSEIHSISFKDVEAVVSDIDLSQFNEKIMKDRFQNDTKWMKKNVLHHHKIIAKGGESSTVIPMKFGTLFKTKVNIEKMLAKSYRIFKRLLEELKNKQEWGVKVYVDAKLFIEQLKKKDNKVRRFEKERMAVPEGMKWYLERKIDTIINQKLYNEIEKNRVKITDELTRHAEKIVINNPLPKELTDRNEDMILNSACLIEMGSAEFFKGDVKRVSEEFGKRGFELEITGPWPPYNFVEKIDERSNA